MLSGTLLRLSLTLSLGAFSAVAQTWQVVSPDQRTRITLELADGRLSYTADLQRTPPAWQVEASGFAGVISESPLGIKTTSDDFSERLSLAGDGELIARSDRYTMFTGKQSDLDNHYYERVITFTNAVGNSIEVHLRAYSEGVAVRYGFPEAGKSLTVVDDLTGFRIEGEGRKWIAPYSEVDQWAPAYETPYVAGIPIGTAANTPVGWAFPALFHANDFWILLTEANLDGSYFASHLQPTAEGGLYRLRLPEETETYGVHPQASTAVGPFHSPWRVIMMGTDPADIVENSLVHHLSAPSRIKDPSWIVPGPSTWSWLFDGSSQTDFDRLAPFIQLAAELGWPYSMVDADWHVMTNGDIHDALDYAAERGVGLTVWYNSGGPTNLVKPIGPADRLHHADLRQKEFAWLQSLGVKGIKVDFMQSDKQGQIQLYIDILRDAAEHELLVFFHGSTLPRGWERTWPNLVSMESVMGGEQLWSQDFADNLAAHNTILPFTRNVVGSMDYTPFTLAGRDPAVIPNTTPGHELATVIVFESGIQHISGTVAHFEELPYYAWRFMEGIEVAWDETRLLAGTPGDFIVLARRKGEKWFLAGLSAREESFTLDLELGFLNSGFYWGEFIGDGEAPKRFSHRRLEKEASGTLSVEFASRGGFVATLDKR